MGQGHPCIPFLPVAGLSQADSSSHSGTTMPQALPKANHTRCRATTRMTLEAHGRHEDAIWFFNLPCSLAEECQPEGVH